MSWILWGFTVLIQNASFTWVSRARNSRSIRYHAIAAVFSNGAWFVSLAFATDKLMQARESGSSLLFVAIGLFYTTLTVIGSISAHHLLMRYVEK